MRKPIAAPEATVRDTDGRVHQIDRATMLAAMERARKYLEEAVRWGKERVAHLASKDEEQDTRRHDRFLQCNAIPKDVWFPIESDLTEADQQTVMAALHDWTKGTMEDFEAQYVWLEEDIDLDPTYILFGVPIYLLPVESQQELRRIGATFAGRACARVAALN